MGTVTKIEWTDHTFNPWIGCSKVHTGCAHCYAETLMATRYGVVNWGTLAAGGTRKLTSADNWKRVRTWHNRAVKEGVRRRVFCASLADVFEDWDGPILDPGGINNVGYCEPCGEWCRQDAPGMSRCCEREPRFATLNDVRGKLFDLIDETPGLDWLILTKRPENVRRMWLQRGDLIPSRFYRENVWVLASASDTETAGEMVRALPEHDGGSALARLYGLSLEPLIGPVDFVTAGIVGPNGPRVSWVIVGGESGDGARPCRLEWILSIIEQARHWGIRCFVKQLGSRVECSDSVLLDRLFGPNRPIHTSAMIRDKKGGDWTEWPFDLRVREYPEPLRNSEA